MEQVDRAIGRIPEHVYLDMGYRGHDCEGVSQIHFDRCRIRPYPSTESDLNPSTDSGAIRPRITEQSVHGFRSGADQFLPIIGIAGRFEIGICSHVARSAKERGSVAG